jgi:hypothetical protein
MSEPESQEKNNFDQSVFEGDPLSRVSTYQDAIKEALRSQDVSASGMLMAEQKKRDNFQAEDREKSFANPKNKFLIGISIVLILAALSFISITIINSSKRIPESTSLLPQSTYFIPEKVIEVSAAQLSRNTLSKIQQATTEPINKGDVTQLIISKEVSVDPTSTFNFTKKASYDTNDFLALITARAPEVIRRTLDQEFMLGVHKASANETFVLFRINNFESSYAAMFEWETALARDMENIFPRAIEKARITSIEEVLVAPVITDLTSTTTPTSTQTETVQKTIDNTRIWHDRVINNTDTRALLNEFDEVVFFYAFIDNEFIFFGTKEETFGEVMRRVRTAKLLI